MLRKIDRIEMQGRRVIAATEAAADTINKETMVQIRAA